MSLTPWRVFVLLAAAAVCVALALLDIASTAAPPSCDFARRSIEHDLVSQAQRAYTKILAQEPERHCAREGMAKVGKAWCSRGDLLRKEGATLEAVKAYTAALDEQPPSQDPHGCALRGLAKANAAAATVDCPDALKASCNVTVVNVNGVNGQNGQNGLNGLNGLNGQNGLNGSNGQNGHNGHNGENGRNGRPGPPGRSGRNGRNGRNGMNGYNAVPPGPCGVSGCS